MFFFFLYFCSCEVRPGPQFFTRHITIFRNGTWEGYFYRYNDSQCSEPKLSLHVRVVVSVGGGGLMSGVLQGMHDVGWADVPLIAMETKGADSFDAAVQAGELVTLDAITRFV